MGFKSDYVSKKPDKQGFIHYTQEDDATWHDLYMRQIDIVEDRACDEYIKGLEMLNMPTHRVPQANVISTALTKATGWSVHPVDALITFQEFFELLSHRKFPAATFIRSREELDYLKEPDIFHEYFGHCPMITHQPYADFMEAYGTVARQTTDANQELLARLYWFTVEFGLINTANGMRIYGGGIISSMEETVYALESPTPQRKPFDALESLRTPVRIDILQPIYFVIDNYQQLFELTKNNLLVELCHEARKLGDLAPAFPPIDEQQEEAK